MIRLLLALVLLQLPVFGQLMQDAAMMQSTSPLRRGLAGYWRLEESSGTRYDCSKNGNHLTANNSPGQAVGKVGFGSTFTNANQQYLSIPSNSTLQAGNISWTMAAWLKPSSFSTYIAICGKDNTGFGQRERSILYDVAANRFAAVIGDGATTINNVLANTFGAPTVDVWVFVAAWYDQSQAKLFISVNNGTADSATVTITPAVGTAAFCIGRLGTSTLYSSGIIDEVGFWKRALTAAERTQLYNAGLGTHFPWAHP